MSYLRKLSGSLFDSHFGLDELVESGLWVQLKSAREEIDKFLILSARALLFWAVAPFH